jgi:hypothetical protein
VTAHDADDGIVVLLCIVLPLRALARPHLIFELGSAPLIGRVASIQQLQSDVCKQYALFLVAAGQEFGLTPAEFQHFRNVLNSADVRTS